MNLKNEILEKSGINEATNQYIHVFVGDDEAEGVFEKGTGKLIFTFDMIHGDNPSSALEFARALGINIQETSYEKLMGKEPEEDTGMSNKIPHLKEIQEAIRKLR